jgi:hypothetical protein
MYRDNHSTKLVFETQMRAVPSPRAEVSAAWRVSFAFCAIWILACIAYYFLLIKYKIAFSTRPKDLTRVVITAIVPVLFTPVLPIHSIVRRFLARRPWSAVTVTFEEIKARLVILGRYRDESKQIGSSIAVRIGDVQHVVAASEGSDAPFSFRLPGEPDARRLAIALNARNFGSGTFSFPVWIGGEVLSALAGKDIRPYRWRKRASLTLLLSGFCGVLVIFGSSSASWGILVFGGPVVLLLGFYFFLMSWGDLLDDLPSGNLTVDASQVRIDGELLCSLTDRLTLTITEVPCLEIAATRIPEGKRLIKPWHVGDRHELELIKATIEAFQARATENAPGASPPNQ